MIKGGRLVYNIGSAGVLLSAFRQVNEEGLSGTIFVIFYLFDRLMEGFRFNWLRGLLILWWVRIGYPRT